MIVDNLARISPGEGLIRGNKKPAIFGGFALGNHQGNGAV